MWRPTTWQWWVLLVVALFVVLAWPPRDAPSLGVKLVRFSVDPWDELPVLPGPLPMGLGDDPEAVFAHDMEIQRYDALDREGGWTRLRLRLKVARDPLDPSTERGLLVALCVVTGFVAWRWSGRKE